MGYIPAPRTRERVLLAASQCEPKDARQAAIIGAIAHTLLDTGRFLPHAIAAHAADQMGWGMTVAWDIDDTIAQNGGVRPTKLDPDDDVRTLYTKRIFPQDGYPTMPEISAAAALFKDKYYPPEAVAA
jgi:hypothetical protein